MEIEYPNNCSVESIFDFCSRLDQAYGENELLINFAPMGRVEPFSMLYVSSKISEYRNNNPETIVMYSNFKGKDYVAHMGFFKSICLDYGKAPGEASGSGTYLPISIINASELEEEAIEQFVEIQDIVENKSEKLSHILSRQSSGNLVDTLTFSIREIMRNIIEHSRSENIYYCAQYWESYNKAEIAILDNGIGIKSSIEQNPYIKVESDSDAIQQVLMPGISSKNYKGARVNTKNPWHNSGFGLYMTNRLCRNGGEFLICSGNHAIHLNEDRKHHIPLNHYLQGTAVKMVLNTARLDTLSTMLSAYRTEGYAIARQIKGTGIYGASAASQMLSRDFK